MKNILILLITSSLFLSCSDENGLFNDCDNGVLSVNKKYEDMFDKASPDRHHQYAILRSFFIDVEDACLENSCAKEVKKINDYYENKIGLAEGDTEVIQDLGEEMWFKINMLDCY